MDTLSVGSIISNGFTLGLKNLFSIFINSLLWLLTCWIPYLNVGTTIGLMSGLVPKISKGEVISPTEIFNPVYRKRMGEWFLTYGLLNIGVLIGLILLVIPAYVISIAWSLALYLVVDKELNPMEALQKSNDMTYGKKWIIFFGFLVLIIIFLIPIAIFSLLGVLGKILIVIAYIIMIATMVGATAHIYGTLSKK